MVNAPIAGGPDTPTPTSTPRLGSSGDRRIHHGISMAHQPHSMAQKQSALERAVEALPR